MGLSGQRVVVIGGTAGIGLAVAAGAIEEGASVVVASSRKERVESAAERLGSSAEAHVLDVTDEKAVEEFFAAVGAFDHIVFTAGDPLRVPPFGSSTVAEARGFFEVRFWGAYAVARYGATGIAATGSITLTSGSQSVRPHKGWPVAGSEAGATESLARALAVELAPVRVNVVRPGPARTEIWNAFPEPDKRFAASGSRLLLGRGAEPEEVAETYLHLMRSVFTTGTVATVDGGLVLI